MSITPIQRIGDLERELAAMTAAHRAAEDRAIVAESRLSAEIALSRKLADNLATAPAERDILRFALRSALALPPQHRFKGSCPDSPENVGDRDPGCSVCQRLIELDADIAESMGETP